MHCRGKNGVLIANLTLIAVGDWATSPERRQAGRRQDYIFTFFYAFRSWTSCCGCVFRWEIRCMYVILGAGFRGRFCCSGRRSGGSDRWQAHRVPSPGHTVFLPA